MAEPAALRTLQERFFRLITSPWPVDQAAAELGAEDQEAVRPERWIEAESREVAFSRLAIYANMYFHRLLEVLRRDYPVLQAAVGTTLFHNMVVDYLAAYPSCNPSVRHVGRHLATFVARHPLADRFPYLAALATLEWARGEMVDAADERPATWEDLVAVPSAEWPTMRLRLVPAHAVLELDFPVHRLWRAYHDRDELPRRLARASTCLLVWRSEHSVHHRVIDSCELRALVLLNKGATLAELAEALQPDPATAEPAVICDQIEPAGENLARMLQGWVRAGLLALNSLDRSSCGSDND